MAGPRHWHLREPGVVLPIVALGAAILLAACLASLADATNRRLRVAVAPDRVPATQLGGALTIEIERGATYRLNGEPCATLGDLAAKLDREYPPGTVVRIASDGATPASALSEVLETLISAGLTQVMLEPQTLGGSPASRSE